VIGIRQGEALVGAITKHQLAPEESLLERIKMRGRILVGYEKLGKIPERNYISIFRNFQSHILKAIDHITEFGVPIYIGKKLLYVPGMPIPQGEWISEGLLFKKLYENNIHPEMADYVLSTIDGEMINMYNNLEEITAIHLNRIKSIKEAVEFKRADFPEKIRIIREAKIIETKTVTMEERQKREEERLTLIRKMPKQLSLFSLETKEDELEFAAGEEKLMDTKREDNLEKIKEKVRKEIEAQRKQLNLFEKKR
jgi:hypothetical protein